MATNLLEARGYSLDRVILSVKLQNLLLSIEALEKEENLTTALLACKYLLAELLMGRKIRTAEARQKQKCNFNQ